MPLHIWLALLLSGLIGVSLGMLGGGGSILALPVLVYVAGVGPDRAVAMSLAIVGATSLAASLMHRRGGRVDGRIGTVFGSAGLPGAFLGARLTHLVPPPVLLSVFALLMLLVGVLMIVRSLRAGETGRRPGRRRVSAILLAGFGVGLLTGFLGVGGGFIIVPALVFFAGLEMPAAIGTSLVVIALNCAAGLAGHFGEGGVPVGETLAFTLVAVLGGAVGERLAARQSPRQLRRAFGVLVLLLGIYVLARNLPAVL